MNERKYIVIPAATKLKSDDHSDPTFGFLINLIPAFIWALVFTDQVLPDVRRRIEIGFNSELNSRRLPIRLRGIICDCTHISEQPHIIVALFGSRNYPVLKQGHDLFRLRNNRELKSQPFEP